MYFCTLQASSRVWRCIAAPLVGVHYPAAEWVQRFQAARMLCDLVNTPLDWLADPHAKAVGAAVPLDQPGLGTLPFPRLPGLGPWSVPAPSLGEHTEEVLREFGL